MADAVDNWIVDSVGLGEQRTPNGDKRCDLNSLENAGIVDHQIWGPGHEPQRNGHQGDFSQFAFGAGCLIFR